MQRSKNDRGFALVPWINAALCILCVYIILHGTRKFGPGMTHDSQAYLSAASALAGGKGLQYFAYTSPYVQWPPLFPCILAAFKWLSADPFALCRYFNAFVMALSLWIGSLTVRRLSRHGFLSSVFVLMGLLSFPLMRVSFFVWSEPLFILFSTIAFHILLTPGFETLHEAQTTRRVVLLAAASALACLTRYVGVVVIASIGFYLLVRLRGAGRKLRITTLYVFISAFPTVVYLIRNMLVSGTLVGMRSPSNIPLSENVARVVKTAASWLFPVIAKPGPLPGPLLVIIPAFCLLLAMLFWVLYRSPASRPTMIFLSGYCLLYSCYLAVSASKVAFDPISDRYMIPVMLPLMSILILVLDGLLERPHPRSKAPVTVYKAANILSVLILSGFLLYSMAANSLVLKDSLQKAHREGAGGFNTVGWRSHAFLQEMGRIWDSDMIYTNEPGAVSFLTGKKVHYMPKTFGLAVYGYEAFLKESVNYQKQSVIWFGKEESAVIYTPSMLKKDFKVTELYRDSTFSMYGLERGNP